MYRCPECGGTTIGITYGGCTITADYESGKCLAEQVEDHGPVEGMACSDCGCEAADKFEAWGDAS